MSILSTLTAENATAPATKRPDSTRTDAAKAATLARRHARAIKRGQTATRAGHRRAQ